MEDFAFLPVEELRDGEIMLRLRGTSPADPAKHLVPAYKFDICLLDGTRVGVCALRVGHTMRLFFGGNIGYGVDAPYRGHHYAARACLMLFELARRHGMEYLYITCAPDNTASARTCRRTGCQYLCTVLVPEDHDMFLAGKRQVMVWRAELRENGSLRTAPDEV